MARSLQLNEKTSRIILGILSARCFLLNPHTEEVKIYRPILDDEDNFSYQVILPEEQVNGLVGVAMAGIYEKQSVGDQWIAICYFDI